MSRILLFVAFLFSIVSVSVKAQDASVDTPDAPVRLGILSDSSTDEYQGSDNRGGAYHAVTFNWVEQLVRAGRVDLGEWGNYDEPRRTGYERNWARSGATAESLLTSGQHTGLAAQDVDLVFVSVGINDFLNNYDRIYDGNLSGEELDEWLNDIVVNITTAVDTVQPVDTVLVTIPDVNNVPRILSNHPDAEKRQRVTDAIEVVNEGLIAMAAERDVTVIDSVANTMDVFSRIVDGKIVVGDISVDPFVTGDDPHNGLLDGLHPGTVMSGILANTYAVGLGIEPLTDEEILASIKTEDGTIYSVESSRSNNNSSSSSGVIVTVDDFFTALNDASLGISQLFRRNDP